MPGPRGSAPLPRGHHVPCRQPASPTPSTPRLHLVVPSHLPTVPCLVCAAAALTGRVRVPLSKDATPRCPSASEPSPLPGRLRRREHDHGERRPSSPLAVLCPWSIELTLPSLLAIAGPPPAIVAPPHRRDAAAEPDFFSSPSTRSSGELAFRPPCLAGSHTIVGARPPSFAPSPPLWRCRRPRRDARVGAVTAPACAALCRAVAGRTGRGRPSEHRLRPRGRGPCATMHLGRAWFWPRGTQIDFSIF
jgi:hypothetical protein